MMNLLIIRHAESQGNASGDYSSEIADSLSANGLKQAEALADSLASWNFDKIIVSPLQRTVQTITPYLTKTEQQGELWPEITEACWHDERECASGCWRPQAAVINGIAADLFNFRDGKAVQPAHPESFGEGLCRVNEALGLIQQLAETSEQNILMVTHGHFIREILNLMLQTSSIIDFAQDNCGTTMMSFDQQWKVEFCNRIII